MTEWHVLTVDASARLDQVVAAKWGDLDRERIRQLVVSEHIQVNGQPALSVGQRLQPGDEVRVAYTAPVTAPASAPLPGPRLAVIHEDDAILLVEKPAGIAVRRPRGSAQAQRLPTVPQLLAQLRPDLANVGSVGRSGVVTTVDEDASGLVLAGKTEEAYRRLRHLVKRRHVVEAYTALVEGRLRSEYTIDEPIGNYKHTRRRLAVAREGRPAQTYVRPQQHYKYNNKDYTLVYVRPETSRMHQIRVHLSWFGFPIVGDRVYGARRQELLADRLFLHLSETTLRHPVTDMEMKVDSALPQELLSVLQYMRRPR